MFNYGTILRIQGQEYDIVGVIQFQSITEPSIWEEYRMFNKATREEMWLSYDDYNGEYSMSKVVLTSGRNIDTNFQGYHIVDRGNARVVTARGNVDVDQGERVEYIELEDMSEDKIKSVEIWEDGSELSEGYYIEKGDIEVIGKSNANIIAGGGGRMKNNSPAKIFAVLAVLCSAVFTVFMGYIGASGTKMSTYIKDSENYTYSTSVTSDIEPTLKADVYKTSLTVDAAAKDIIKGIDGNTQSVQQNNEDEDDNSVAIMTKDEYCLVYEDSESGETLVQICTRLYAYSSSSEPYHSRRTTGRYYRRYYYTKGYSSDKGSYGGDHTSSYGSYNDTTVSTNSNDIYSNYSNSVRQASVASRSSSGGGTSSGK